MFLFYFSDLSNLGGLYDLGDLMILAILVILWYLQVSRYHLSCFTRLLVAPTLGKFLVQNCDLCFKCIRSV